jgi:hypothetical protein
MEGPFDTADFLTVSEQHGADTWSYGTLFDLRGMTGEPTIAELRQIMSRLTSRIDKIVAVVSSIPTPKLGAGPSGCVQERESNLDGSAAMSDLPHGERR